ncbi:hypothetical protein EX30DRAFT_38999 [Ascodesmis nigricans]|uniref:Uncharacterized protein n=1 Tax=Ascodesmis nigricans TaxID=341454 RepID=A0A4S2MW54_9PEZI|nr:hypothetical protein EX30DRAFT_38999 [Ascodesmis nigricans]
MTSPPHSACAPTQLHKRQHQGSPPAQCRAVQSTSVQSSSVQSTSIATYSLINPVLTLQRSSPVPSPGILPHDTSRYSTILYATQQYVTIRYDLPYHTIKLQFHAQAGSWKGDSERRIYTHAYSHKSELKVPGLESPSHSNRQIPPHSTPRSNTFTHPRTTAFKSPTSLLSPAPMKHPLHHPPRPSMAHRASTHLQHARTKLTQAGTELKRTGTTIKQAGRTAKDALMMEIFLHPAPIVLILFCPLWVVVGALFVGGWWVWGS